MCVLETVSTADDCDRVVRVAQCVCVRDCEYC